jgi:hypothetical protein
MKNKKIVTIMVTEHYAIQGEYVGPEYHVFGESREKTGKHIVKVDGKEYVGRLVE